MNKNNFFSIRKEGTIFFYDLFFELDNQSMHLKILAQLEEDFEDHIDDGFEVMFKFCNEDKYIKYKPKKTKS